MASANSINKTYSLSLISKDIWKNINSLTQENIKQGTLPYIENNPYPQDLNLVNESHLGDINKIQLELGASLMNAKSLEWVFAADAEMIGLELKQNSNGFFMQKNLSRNGDASTDVQFAFLKDQFTPESIKKLFNPSYLESLSKNTESLEKIKKISHQFIINMDEYNRGERENFLIKEKKENLKNNLNNDYLKEKIRETTQKITHSYDNNQKKVFDHLQNYYLKQITGFGTYKLTEENKKSILQAFKEISIVETPRLTELLTESFVLADRKTHYEFAKENIYSELDKTKSVSVLTPSLEQNKEQTRKDKSQEKLRDRDRTLRPHHTRGRQ